MDYSLDELLDALSPDVLRARFQQPYAAWREEFVPRFLSTRSHVELQNEFGRFVSHILERRHGDVVSWSPELAQERARQLVESRFGSSLFNRAGEFAAMKRTRHADNGGLRRLLDELTQSLQDEAVTQYLELFVIPEVLRLDGKASLELARRYLDRFDVLPGLELECPASIAMRWRQVIHQHAHLVLHG